MKHEFGYWKKNVYVCNRCDVPHKRDGEECGQDAYARGLAEGRAQGLEDAADHFDFDPTLRNFGDLMRDRAAEIRKEGEK
jgi:hypothetical protein